MITPRILCLLLRFAPQQRPVIADNLNDLIVPALGISNIDGSPLADKVTTYFGKAPKVESIAHTQYFQQARTWDFIVESLK
jgi:hypothetical protein